MSNKTQLQTNNTALDALITRVNAAKDIAASLPDAGGSGGGDVETCTVTFHCDLFEVRDTSYVRFYNGRFYIGEEAIADGTVFENIVSNSEIRMYDTTSVQVESVDGTSYHEGWGHIYIGTSDTTITFE